MSAKNKENSKKGKKAEKDKKKKKEQKDEKSVAKTKCHAPIASGAVMAQRVLPPTVCCPPPGSRVGCCLHGPGFRNC